LLGNKILFLSAFTGNRSATQSPSWQSATLFGDIQMKTASEHVNRLIPVKEWPQEHPWPPEGGLRHLIFHSTKNGFDQVIVRCGRRVLIDEAAFFEWARTNGREAPGGAK
jgi:hypothetical protein